MQSSDPEPGPEGQLAELIEALNLLRDALTRTALELRDLQFDLDTAQRYDATQRANELVKAVK
jgi:predicted glycosyltransferase